MANNYVSKTDIDRQKITECEADGCDWMSFLRDDLTIRDLTMFGTHCSCDPNIQKKSLPDQLKCGARFLDLHLAEYDNEVWVHHYNPCIKLVEAFVSIMKFLKCNDTEKVIVYLRNSNTGGKEVDWTEMKTLFPENITEKFIAKSESEKKVKEMKGNIILVAPKELDIDSNWGKDSISPYFAPEDTNTLTGLHAFLFELAVDELDERKNKLVWVEVRSRCENDKQKQEDEITEVTDVFIKDTEFYNIVTFSLLDSEHFKRLKDNNMFKFSPP